MRLKVLFLTLLLGFVLHGGMYAFCGEEYPDTWCYFQCDKVGGMWMCFEPAIRCCWESPTGNVCGDAYTCDECFCSIGAGGF